MPATRDTLPLGTKYHTSIRTEGELTIVRLYGTDIVTVTMRGGVPVICKLYTGGFGTPTTYRRMNEALAHFRLLGPGRMFEHRVGTEDFRHAGCNSIVRTNEE
jgi:hypothetical protein